MSEALLSPTKCAPGASANRNFLRGPAEAWSELANMRNIWEKKSGGIDLPWDAKVTLRAAQLGRDQLVGHLRAVVGAEVDLTQ
eukprot:1095210-Alexandrium_andersonii.AAC.1